jgi:hypothetical protein
MLPKPFLSRLMQILNSEKSSPKMWGTFVIEKLPKLISHLMGESGHPGGGPRMKQKSKKITLLTDATKLRPGPG